MAREQKKFEELVALKYQLYNGLFLTLPFADLLEVGVELSVFAQLCRKELVNGKSAKEIVTEFFQKIAKEKNSTKQKKILFLILQFVERQVVLFDALEEAAFSALHSKQGPGSLHQLYEYAQSPTVRRKLEAALKHYCARIVLTAHPTQFYPTQVLGIIHYLSVAISNNNLKEINDLLLQLGKTSFKNRRPPTPYDEAKTLLKYLEEVFYPVVTNIQYSLSKHFNLLENGKLHAFVEVGFWPGGDRDGNPNVTADITWRVALKLKERILAHYINELRKLRHRLTFSGVYDAIEHSLNRIKAAIRSIYSDNTMEVEPYKSHDEFLRDLFIIRKKLIRDHQALFLNELDRFICSVQSFGFHFASMDLRQDSRVHENLVGKLLQPKYHYQKLSAAKKMSLLTSLLQKPPARINKSFFSKDKLLKDTLESLQVAKKIQQINGEWGMHRYIVSNTQAAYHILEVMLLGIFSSWQLSKLNLDFVPLFETIKDLHQASEIMQELFKNKIYRTHLKRRKDLQTIMLGFSDGTKDGGYVSANWEIYRAKEKLYQMAKSFRIQIVFFEGRGGPPARGGGKTHLFYRAMEFVVPQYQIQLTVQGQTISSKFGSIDLGQYNIEQLFTSALESKVLPQEKDIQKLLHTYLNKLSEISFHCYQQLRQNPLFIDYLEEVTPLKYYGELNIASRPAKRKQSKGLVFEDLRAIPFVGAWSQMKQNIPGFYGLGTALAQLVKEGHEKILKKLYRDSLFFRTLIDNAMQSLLKTNFSLTGYLKADKKYAKFWQQLYREAKLCEKMVLLIANQDVLLEADPMTRASILFREDLVLPLLIIQQYALQELRDKKTKTPTEQKKIWRKLIIKSLAANINASRNAV